MRSAIDMRWAFDMTWAFAALAAAVWLPTSAGCSADEAGSDASATPDTITTTDRGNAPLRSALGGPCRQDSDCIAGICFDSEYGPPWCSRACESAGEACPAGEDAGEGEAFCLDYGTLPQPPTAGLVFEGEINRFCARRCDTTEQCRALNGDWEICERPGYLGDPLDASLGGAAVCQAPSFHGKDPVDPSTCSFSHIIDLTEQQQASDANLCRRYCDYMQRCQEIDKAINPDCCAWGCFVRMWPEGSHGEQNDAWSDDVGCYVQEHAAWPDVGVKNSCTEPPKACGALPKNPTPHASR